MINEENITDIIDQYLRNELEGEELEEVEERLASDPQFRSEVEAQKAVLNSLRILGRESLRDQFKGFHRELDLGEETSARETRVRRLWTKNRYYAIAASVALAIVSGIILYTNRAAGPDPLVAVTFKAPVFDSQSGLGIAGDVKVVDSVVIQLSTHAEYDEHYQFTDTLRIYQPDLSLESNSIHLEFDANSNGYYLVIDSTYYIVEKGFAIIQRLVPEP